MPLSNPFGEVIFRATVAVPGNNEATIIPLGTSVATQRPYKYALDGMQLSAGDDVYVIPISGTYVLLGGAVAGGGGNLPAGGTDGDVLVKNGATDYDARWTNTPPQMGSLATIEPTSTVTQKTQYVQGEYLVYNGQLYKVRASTISQGETLDPTPGSGNIEAANIGEVIYQQPLITGVLATETFGTLSYSFNPNIKVACIMWVGNGTNSQATTKYYSIPNTIKPTQRYITQLYNGKYLQVDNNGAQLEFTNAQWSAGYICYLVG